MNFILEKDKAAQYGIDRVPALALLTQDPSGSPRDTRIRFLGTPAGYEFVSLVQAVMLAGGHESQLTPENRARVAAVEHPDHHSGVLDPDLTALSAGGQPRA